MTIETGFNAQIFWFIGQVWPWLSNCNIQPGWRTTYLIRKQIRKEHGF